jgi:hypothetical protein
MDAVPPRPLIPGRADRPSRQDVRWAHAVGVGGILFVAGAYAALGMRQPSAQYLTWAAPVAGMVFFGMQLVAPRCAVRFDAPLSPLNWALYAFALQLVIMPLLVEARGASLAVLPRLAGKDAVNSALLISAASFVAFAAGVQLAGRMGRSLAPPAVSQVPLRKLGIASLFIGATGLIVKFGGLGTYWSAITNPVVMAEAAGPEALAGWRGGVSLMLTPFLTVGSVAVWSVWMDRNGATAPRSKVWGVTVAAATVVVLTGASYSFNRATFYGPLVAMAAAYSWRIRRLSFKALAAGGGVALFLALAIGAYKWNTTGLGSVLTSAEARKGLASETDVMMQFQMYGQAPQFFGYLLEEARAERSPFGPRTLVASVLSPLPVIGKPFRDETGVANYNRLIYGNIGVADQPLPFVGEAYLSLGLGGMFLGFLLLGICAAWLDRTFRRSRSTFDAYLCQYTAIFLLFLIQGTLGAVSQTFFYFFAPVYVYLMLKWANAARRPAIASTGK